MIKKLFIIVNEDSFFLSHRLRIAEMAKENGWDVTIAAKDTGKKKVIEKYGFRFQPLPINPTGMNILEELKLLKFLSQLFKKHRESVIHLVGLKNMLWGGLAAKMTNKERIVFAVSGLGTLFGEKRSNFITKRILSLLKRGIKGKSRAIIFQNLEDLALFQENKVYGNIPVYLLKGSGVVIKDYRRDDLIEHQGKVKIIFTGRMLREKGVEDLIAAAKILRPQYENKVEFWLCGDVTNNRDSLSKNELEKINDGGYIKWLGFREDIPDLLSDADIMCYPSYYREGVPKSLLEASAASLPIITTDSVGCRDTVEDGKNGYLVTTHSPVKIARALDKLIKDKELRISMGRYSRRKAEKEYDVESVAAKHLEIYDYLLNDQV